MGEDKSRGTENERGLRVAQDIQRDIAEAREAGLPDHAVFCGYVVHVPSKNDYLATVMENNGNELRNYSQSPEYAIRYASRDQAERAAAELRHPGVVGILFDVGSRLVVLFDDCDAD